MKLKSFKQFVNTLSESIIDPASDLLSEIFQNRDQIDSPMLVKDIKIQIEKDIGILEKQFPKEKLSDYFIVGSNVTYQYNPSSDIDVTVVYKDDTNPDVLLQIATWANTNLNGKYLYLNRLPINYYITCSWSRNKLENVDAAYDPEKDVWIKKPSKGVELNYYQTLIASQTSLPHQKAMSLEQDLKKQLTWFYNILLAGYLNDMTNMQYELGKLYCIYTCIHEQRKAAYENETSVGELPSLNWTDANIIYKFLDHDHYIEFFSYLKDLVALNRNTVTEGQVNQFKYQLLLLLNKIL